MTQENHFKEERDATTAPELKASRMRAPRAVCPALVQGRAEASDSEAPTRAGEPPRRACEPVSSRRCGPLSRWKPHRDTSLPNVVPRVSVDTARPSQCARTPTPERPGGTGGALAEPCGAGTRLPPRSGSAGHSCPPPPSQGRPWARDARLGSTGLAQCVPGHRGHTSAPGVGLWSRLREERHPAAPRVSVCSSGTLAGARAPW